MSDKPKDTAAAQVGERDLQTFNKVLEKTLAENNDQLRAALMRAQTILSNMAQENEGAIFNRWPISHEPLRADAKCVLPQIEAALAAAQVGEPKYEYIDGRPVAMVTGPDAQVGEPPEIKMMPWFGDEINATIERCAQVAKALGRQLAVYYEGTEPKRLVISKTGEPVGWLFADAIEAAIRNLKDAP